MSDANPIPDPAPAEALTPDGVQVAGSELSPADDAAATEEEGAEIGSPAKIIRIGAMVKQLLEEVRTTPLDDAARGQLKRIYESSIDELKTSLSPELGSELDSLSFDFTAEDAPSEAELRMAQAQLVGWLEGLFHGIQATLVAQQMAARQQLDGVRGELQSGPGAAPTPGPGYI
ncbi:bacterial proteasome activator family protein [soil metagenome]